MRFLDSTRCYYYEGIADRLKKIHEANIAL